MRMLKGLAVVVCVIASGVLGYFVRGLAEQGVQPHGYYTFNDKWSDPQLGGLLATGTWQGADLASPINTVRIFCDRNNRSCELHQADITTLTGTSFLTLDSTTFSISQADAKLMTAINESAACVRQTLVIDRQAQSVSLVRTKTNKEGMCAMVQDAPFTISLADPRKAIR